MIPQLINNKNNSVIHYESYSISFCGGHKCGNFENVSVCFKNSVVIAYSHEVPVSINLNGMKIINNK